MHVGLFGGSFNPPHLGHLVVAEALREACGLDRVIWMVAAQPPHKIGADLAPPEDRLEMTHRAIADNPRFVVSDLEVRRAAEKGGPSYTVDTLRQLTAALPSVRWSLLVGEDSLAAFHTWRAPDEILAMADLVVYRRPGVEGDDAPMRRFARVVDAGRLDVSSTDLRARLRAGRSTRYLLPDAVADYVAARGLYR